MTDHYDDFFGVSVEPSETAKEISEKAFDESKHPRDHGKFDDSGGSSGSSHPLPGESGRREYNSSHGSGPHQRTGNALDKKQGYAHAGDSHNNFSGTGAVKIPKQHSVDMSVPHDNSGKNLYSMEGKKGGKGGFRSTGATPFKPPKPISKNEARRRRIHGSSMGPTRHGDLYVPRDPTVPLPDKKK